MTEARYLTVAAYAAKYGVGRTTVFKWLSVPGILTTYRVERVLRILDVPPQCAAPPAFASVRAVEESLP